MDLFAYLVRIHYLGSLQPDLDTLRRLHRAHMLAVPFENLDIPLGRSIILDEELLFTKIVTGRRGGFCYELNGLFAALLRRMGYRVDMLAARVADGEGGYGIEFDHLALLVHLDEPWLVDVGFGDSFIEPLRLGETRPQVQSHGAYMLRPEADRYLYMKQQGCAWLPQYIFTLQPYQLADFESACQYNQTSPQSSFTRRRVCSRATPDGRLTLSDGRLIHSVDGARQESEVRGEAEVARLLRQHFGVNLGIQGTKGWPVSSSQ